MDKNDGTFELQQHIFGCHTIQTHKFSYSYTSTDEAVLHSIKPVLVELGAKLKRKISKITTTANDDIKERSTFVSHARHLKASTELIADLWCIVLKILHATLVSTTQMVIGSARLPLARRYRADRFFSMRRLNAPFLTDTLFSDVRSINQNTCAQVFLHKVGFNATYPMVSSTGDSLGY